MLENYFFIDGSALLSQIREIQKKLKLSGKRKLDPIKLIDYFCDHLYQLGSQEYKRAVFYFPRGDEITINEYLQMPNFKKSGLIRDLYFKYCGQKIKGSAAFNKFVLDKVPKKWRGHCTKSEKGIDIEICCDALRLATIGKMERLFLLSNDSDFVPLCKTLKDFGVNVSLISLSEIIEPNRLLLKECDSYDVVQKENLQNMFIPTLAVSNGGTSINQ